MIMMMQYINCVVIDTSADCQTKAIVLQVQILVTCSICEISAVCKNAD